ALVERATKGGMQIDYRIAIVPGKRKAETRQLLLQRGGINLKAVRLRRAGYGHCIVPVGQAVARVVEHGLPLQDEINLDEARSRFLAFAAFCEVGLPAA